MKRNISSPTFWVGFVFCIIAALAIVIAENKRLSILSAQKDAGSVVASGASEEPASDTRPVRSFEAREPLSIR
jgi:hypothetical protein